MGLLYLGGIAGCVWLISSCDPGSFWYVWGVIFAVVNVALIIRGDW